MCVVGNVSLTLPRGPLQDLDIIKGVRGSPKLALTTGHITSALDVEARAVKYAKSYQSFEGMLPCCRDRSGLMAVQAQRSKGMRTSRVQTAVGPLCSLRLTHMQGSFHLSHKVFIASNENPVFGPDDQALCSEWLGGLQKGFWLASLVWSPRHVTRPAESGVPRHLGRQRRPDTPTSSRCCWSGAPTKTRSQAGWPLHAILHHAQLPCGLTLRSCA